VPDRCDPIRDWREELRRVAARPPELPAGARQAVEEVVTAFAREDAADPALHLRAWLGQKARS
jgi:hypothetical protein